MPSNPGARRDWGQVKAHVTKDDHGRDAENSDRRGIAEHRGECGSALAAPLAEHAAMAAFCGGCVVALVASCGSRGQPADQAARSQAQQHRQYQHERYAQGQRDRAGQGPDPIEGAATISARVLQHVSTGRALRLGLEQAGLRGRERQRLGR